MSVLLLVNNIMQHFLSIILVSISGLFGSLYPNFNVHSIESLQTVHEKIRTHIASFETIVTNISHRLNIIENQQLQNKPVVGPESETENIPLQRAIINRDQITAENIIFFTNRERIAKKLNPVKYSGKLSKSAKAKGSDMLQYNYFAHESPQPSHHDFSYFIDQQNYQFIRISENLAMGEFTTAQEVVTAWMNSPGHRANILYANYRDIGVSISNKKNKNGGSDIVIVQHFGTPKTSCVDIPQELTEQLETISNDANQAKERADSLKSEIDAQTKSLDEKNLYDLIETYNTTIRSYNALVDKFKKITDLYNVEAKKYNTCITK